MSLIIVIRTYGVTFTTFFFFFGGNISAITELNCIVCAESKCSNHTDKSDFFFRSSVLKTDSQVSQNVIKKNFIWNYIIFATYRHLIHSMMSFFFVLVSHLNADAADAARLAMNSQQKEIINWWTQKMWRSLLLNWR